MRLNILVFLALAVTLVNAHDAMARGGGKSSSSGSSSSRPSSSGASSSAGSKAAKDVEEESKRSSGGVSININRVGSGSGSSYVPAGAAGAAGVVYGNSVSANRGAPPPTPVDEKKQREEMLAYEKRLAEERAQAQEAKARAEETAQRHIDEAQQRKLAAEKAAQLKVANEERRRRIIAWEERCVIKPVMTDEEIEICREVRTRPAPY